MVWKKTPTSAEYHVFREIDAHNKKHHPIRFFFQDAIPDWFGHLKYRWRERWWAVLHRLHPNHRYYVVHTGLKPGYYDIPVLMLHATFALLVRYVEDEDCFNHVVWDNDPVHACVASELTDLYHWWTVEYPKRDKIETELYREMDTTGLFTGTPYSANNTRITEILRALELRWEKEDIYNLKRLVAIKDFMWT